MTKFLLAVHVLAAILAIGPVAVAASMFPAAAQRSQTRPADVRTVATAEVLNRICRVYAVVGIVVPVFGFAVASMLHVLGSVWLIISIALTAIAAAMLALLVLPGQGKALAELTAGTETAGASVDSVPDRRGLARLGMYTGIFNLLWAAVTVLMIVRPGSTTGV